MQAQDSLLLSIDTTLYQELEGVIVSATRTERQLSSLPLPAKIITKEQIQQTNATRLSDILNEQTGIVTVPDFGGGEGVQLQGLDSEYVMILIDGVPLVGRSAGTLDLQRITVGNIQQIEIVKGASSCLYGSEALGGVINIVTEKPKTGWNGGADYRFSTFNTHDANLNFSYKKEKWSIRTFLNRFSSAGYDLNEETPLQTVAPYTNYTLNTTLNYDFSEKTNLSISGRYFTQNQDNIPTETLRGESVINEWNGHLTFNHTYNERWSSQAEFYSTQYRADEFLDDENGDRFSDSYFNQRLIRPEFRTTFSPNLKHNITAGAGVTHESLDRTYFLGVPNFTTPYIFAQYDIYPLEKLNLIAGLRFDRHSAYSSQWSPKLAARYEISNKIAVPHQVCIL